MIMNSTETQVEVTVEPIAQKKKVDLLSLPSIKNSIELITIKEKRTNLPALQIAFKSNKANLAQAHSSGFQFSLVSKTRKQLVPFVYCKDFMHDAYYARINKTKVSIYGFSVSKDINLSLDAGRFMIANSTNRSFHKCIPSVVDFIHQIEDVIGISKSKFFEIPAVPKRFAAGGVFYIKTSNRWIHAPALISLYTLLIRIGTNHEIGNSYKKTIENSIKNKYKECMTGDFWILKDSIKTINEIISKDGDKKFFKENIKENYPINCASTVHDDYGILAFSLNR